MNRRYLLILLACVAAVALLAVGLGFGSPDEGVGEDSAAPAQEDFGWLSVIPPVLAIGMALVTRQVVVALLLGVYCGSLIITGNPGSAFLRVGDTYLLGALAEKSRDIFLHPVCVVFHLLQRFYLISHLFIWVVKHE